MIIGIGNDVCDIRRIEKMLERFGERFLDKVFTDEERRKAYGRAHPARTLAKRFAAKEALSKALGTGFRSGVHMKDIGIVNSPSAGRPSRLPGVQPSASKASFHRATAHASM